MIQMQTNLDVADNSGARRVMCIKVLGGSKRRYATRRRHHRRVDQGSHPARQVKKGDVHEGRRRAHRARTSAAPTARSIRFDRNAAVLINKQSRADRHPHLRAGAARAARQEPHEDHLARAGGAVMAAKIRKGDKVVVLTGRDKGQHRRSARGDAEGQHGARVAASTWSSATPSRPRRPAGRHHRARKRRSTCRTSRIVDRKDGKPTRVGFKIQDGRQEGPCRQDDRER